MSHPVLVELLVCANLMQDAVDGAEGRAGAFLVLAAL